MERVCEVCKKKYNVQDSTSFFRFQFCRDECEGAAEANIKEVHMYICHSPLTISIYDDTQTGENAVVADGTKWRRDETQSRGLNVVHLETLSGSINEKITWLELSEDVLEKHFQKI